jgi:hypothetical protein
MPFESKKISKAAAWAPTTGTSPNAHQTSRLWSLTQMGTGLAGRESRTLACVFDKVVDEGGNFLSESPRPVIGAAQHHPAVARQLRGVQVRVAKTEDARTGIVHRKLPYANGRSNTWITSAETAMQSLVEQWGRVYADHNSGIYLFERLNIEPYEVGAFPDIDDLIDEVLADFVIESLEHPVLQRLLGAKPATGTPTPYPATGSSFNLEADDEVY